MGLQEEIKQSHFKSALDKALLNILFTNEWLTNKTKVIFKSFGLTQTQYNIMRILAGAKGKPLSPGQIKEVMIFSSSDLTRLIDRLLAKGYVSRMACPSNRRKVDILITDKGQNLLDRMNPKLEEALEKDIKTNLSKAEAETLSQLLDKLRG